MGSDTYKVNATSFPDEDGDRLFIIIPKQAAWLGGLVDLVEKGQAGLKLTEAQIAELEKEFMATFETFTVILSLSKKQTRLYTLHHIYTKKSHSPCAYAIFLLLLQTKIKVCLI